MVQDYQVMAEDHKCLLLRQIRQFFVIFLYEQNHLGNAFTVYISPIFTDKDSNVCSAFIHLLIVIWFHVRGKIHIEAHIVIATTFQYNAITTYLYTVVLDISPV